MNEKKGVDFESMVDGTASDDTLERLSGLVYMQIELEDALADLAAIVKEKGEALRKISEEDIPSVLDETGLSEVRLADGTKVIVKENLRVSTAGANREVINRWLEQEGHDDVIKDEVKALFGKGEGDKAEALIAAAAEFTNQVDRKRYVNPQTFAALLRELMAEGSNVPLDELGVYIQRQTKLDRP